MAKIPWVFALFCLIFGQSAQPDGGIARVHKVQTWNMAAALIGLAWSPDGESLATSSDFGRTLTIWTADGKRKHEFTRHLNNGPYLHNSIAFLSGGKLLLTPPEAGTEKRALSIWDIATGKVIRDVPGPFPAKHFRFNEAQFFAVSPDTSMVAAVSSLILGQPVTVYSTRDWSVLHTYSMEPGPRTSPTATALAFSPDGKQLAIGQLDGTITIHALGRETSPTNTIAAYDPRMLARIESLAFSPDGKYLATGVGLVMDAYKSLASVKIWRLGDYRMTAAYLPGGMPVRSISWSSNGSYVAIAAGDATVRIRSTTAPSASDWTSVTLPGPVAALAFSPKRNVLATASASTVSLFDVTP